MSDQHSYDPASIEPKWQAQWEADGLYHSDVDWSRPKHYALTMLPYPSGDLHIGHWFAITPSDAHARYMRMKGYNVLFPMGFDSFGLPAENAAVKRGVHPATWTHANIDRMRGQLKSMGAMFDWRREISSCDPSYYRWTQWLFREFVRHGLAYRGEAIVNWSPSLQTVLANEQVMADGTDERTGQPVIQRPMTQWFFAQTKYADELLDASKIDWSPSVLSKQADWIGRSEGARVTFSVEGSGEPIEVFTTRPDTLWGATFMVLAPEHPLVATIPSPGQRKAVDAYVEAASHKSELDRKKDADHKTGVDSGARAINPVSGEAVPIWIADYVLVSYGTGAIMAVPAHDERDFAFARTFDIAIRPVIQPADSEPLDGATMAEAYVGPGVMVNSGPIDGTAVNEEKGRKNPSIAAAIDHIEAEGCGSEAINYRLHDWLISRQRYWGCPIPMVYAGDVSPDDPGDAALHEVGDEDLPVLLPEDVEFSGRSPLKIEESFYKTERDGQPATRETDTMDTFMCSSWYQYRYLSPGYEGGPFDPEEAAYWLPVDVYTGGEEHATMHLVYTRFFTKAMRDMGIFGPTEEAARAHGRDTEGLFDEPMIVLRNQGQILGEMRPGHVMVCEGPVEGAVMHATSVRVIGEGEQAPEAAAGQIVGELMLRKETTLHIAGSKTIVECTPETEITIPGIEGPGKVGQLQHHLEIQRMSKTKGNVVNPDELVARYGTDTVRGYMMFAFDWRKGGPWDSQNILGVQRFLNDCWRLVHGQAEGGGETGEAVERELQRVTHVMIGKVTQSLETYSFNTAIAGLMELKNALNKARSTAGCDAWNEATRALVTMLAPFCPHIAEELWCVVGDGGSVHLQSWPEADESLARSETITLVVQVRGKVRGRIEVDADIDEAAAIEAALAESNVQKHIDGKAIRKAIFVPGKLVNLVV